MNGVEAVLRLGLFTLAAQYNVVYIAVVHLGTSLVLTPFYLAKTNRLIQETSWTDYFKGYRTAFMGTSLMMIGLLALRFGLESESLPPAVILSTAIFVGGLLYFGTVFLVDSDFIKDTGQFVYSVVRNEWKELIPTDSGLEEECDQ